MKTLIRLGAAFGALCFLVALYGLWQYAKMPNKPFAGDAIIAVGRSYSLGEGLVALRRNNLYEQWIVDGKTGRVWLHTGKWEQGSHFGMGSETDIFLHKPLNDQKVIKTGQMAGAGETSLYMSGAELYSEPTPGNLSQIAVWHRKWNSDGTKK